MEIELVMGELERQARTHSLMYACMYACTLCRAKIGVPGPIPQDSARGLGRQQQDAQARAGKGGRANHRAWVHACLFVRARAHARFNRAGEGWDRYQCAVVVAGRLAQAVSAAGGD